MKITHTSCIALLVLACYQVSAQAPNDPRNDGSVAGADVKNDPIAKAQDRNDAIVNKNAVIAEANEDTGKKAAGGKGGVDPATGETLMPLPAVSEFCKGTGQAIADGSQIQTGFCSSVAQGQIPRDDRMVSTIITEPSNGANIVAGASFDVSLLTANMKTGFFDAAATEYYTQSQTLDDRGFVKGHQHVTIQKIDNPKKAPNANEKVFFKGLNDAADGSGKLTVNVPAGTIKEPGLYRICSLAGSFSHQPVLMPIAQRGSQDDCIRVTVTAGEGGADRAAVNQKPNKDDAAKDDEKKDNETSEAEKKQAAADEAQKKQAAADEAEKEQNKADEAEKEQVAADEAEKEQNKADEAEKKQKAASRAAVKAKPDQAPARAAVTAKADPNPARAAAVQSSTTSAAPAGATIAVIDETNKVAGDASSTPIVSTTETTSAPTTTPTTTTSEAAAQTTVAMKRVKKCKKRRLD